MPKSLTAHLSRSVTHFALGTPSGHSTWTPNTDVYESADQTIVKMELAGTDKGDLEVTLHGRLLVVCGCREDACRPRQQRCSFRQMEIDYGFFERRIVIAHAVDGKRVRARFQNGFLRVELPKAARAEPTALAILIELLA